MNKEIIDKALIIYKIKHGTGMGDIALFIDILKSVLAEEEIQKYPIDFIPEVIALLGKKYKTKKHNEDDCSGCCFEHDRKLCITTMYECDEKGIIFEEVK